MDLDLDPDLRESLSVEAERRGFDTTEAYVRWLLEHRQAILQPPGERVEARLEQLAGRVESLTHALADADSDQFRPDFTNSEPSDWFDTSREADAWTADAEAQKPDAEAADETAGFAFVGEDDAEEDDSVAEFAYSDDLEPPDGSTKDAAESASDPKDGADDDEIADAIADIDIDEETDSDDE